MNIDEYAKGVRISRKESVTRPDGSRPAGPDITELSDWFRGQRGKIAIDDLPYEAAFQLFCFLAPYYLTSTEEIEAGKLHELSAFDAELAFHGSDDGYPRYVHAWAAFVDLAIRIGCASTEQLEGLHYITATATRFDMQRLADIVSKHGTCGTREWYIRERCEKHCGHPMPELPQLNAYAVA